MPCGVYQNPLVFLSNSEHSLPLLPAQFLGCGVCDAHSRSQVLPTPTDNASVIASACLRLAKVRSASRAVKYTA